MWEFLDKCVMSTTHRSPAHPFPLHLSLTEIMNRYVLFQSPSSPRVSPSHLSAALQSRSLLLLLLLLRVWNPHDGVSFLINSLSLSYAGPRVPRGCVTRQDVVLTDLQSFVDCQSTSLSLSLSPSLACARSLSSLAAALPRPLPHRSR